MRRQIALAAALAAPLLAAPASGQVVGEWKFRLEEAQSVTLAVTRDPSNPGILIGEGTIDGRRLVFVGEFRNLKWVGTWYWYGPGSRRLPGLRTCAAPVAPRPGTPGYGTRTTHTGGFEFTFNAAEDRITGSWKSACSGADGRAESGLPVAFLARRMNTYAAAPPTTTYRPAAVSTGSSGASPAPLDPRLAGEERVDDSPCTARFGLRLSATGRSAGPATVFSARYRLRPCMTSAGKWVQVDMLSPEGKRPIRLVLQGLSVRGIVPAGERQELLASPSGRTLQQGLRFVGEPRAGEVISRIGMSGGICSAPVWLAWLDFSDGTRSREPIGLLISACGAQAHPEMLPPRLPEPEDIRPAGEATPRP